MEQESFSLTDKGRVLTTILASDCMRDGVDLFDNDARNAWADEVGSQNSGILVMAQDPMGEGHVEGGDLARTLLGIALLTLQEAGYSSMRDLELAGFFS